MEQGGKTGAVAHFSSSTSIVSSKENLLESRFFILAERQRAAHIHSKQSKPPHALSTDRTLGSSLGESLRFCRVTGDACHSASDTLGAAACQTFHCARGGACGCVKYEIRRNKHTHRTRDLPHQVEGGSIAGPMTIDLSNAPDQGGRARSKDYCVDDNGGAEGDKPESIPGGGPHEGKRIGIERP